MSQIYHSSLNSKKLSFTLVTILYTLVHHRFKHLSAWRGLWTDVFNKFNIIPLLNSTPHIVVNLRIGLLFFDMIVCLLSAI